MEVQCVSVPPGNASFSTNDSNRYSNSDNAEIEEAHETCSALRHHQDVTTIWIKKFYF